MLEKVRATAAHIHGEVGMTPEVGIILGTGLGGLVRDIEQPQALAYQDIPGFPLSTVEGHSGRLVFGRLGGKAVVAMQGRFHYYEGYTMQEVTFPVRVMRQLGIRHLFVSNASGGVNPSFEVGDLMIINDHINLMPNPLIGPNVSEWGPRFPDMSQPYDRRLISMAHGIAHRLGIPVREGCYVATTGPTFETPKEYQHFRIIGGDTVGMSTAPEVIVARHMGLPVFAISIITDLGVPGRIVEISHEEVQRVGQQAEQKMTQIMEELIRAI